MCQIVITLDNKELDTAHALIDHLTDRLGRTPTLILHPACQNGYNPDQCLCPFELEQTFKANSIPYTITPEGDFQIV